MENKRKKARADGSVSVPKTEKPSSEITLDMFLANCVREGKLKHWQQKEVAAFLRDMKLREKEDLEVYEAMLGKY